MQSEQPEQPEQRSLPKLKLKKKPTKPDFLVALEKQKDPERQGETQLMGDPEPLSSQEVS